MPILFNLNKNCKKQAQFYSDGKLSCSHIGDYGKYLERSQTTVSSKKRLIFVSEKKFTHSWEFFKKFTHSWEFFKDRNQNKLVSKRVEVFGYKSNNFERLLLFEQKYFC